MEFSLHKLDLDKFIDQLEKSKYGMDEVDRSAGLAIKKLNLQVLFSTLNSNLPDFPGGFTTDCLLRHKRPVTGMGR